MKAGVDFPGVGVGVMVRNSNGDFLFGLRSLNSKNEQGKWCFPGGAIDFGEKLFDCAKREAKEEAGIIVEPFRLVTVIDHIIAGEKQHWVNPIIEAKLLSGVPKVLEQHKMTEWRWFSFDALPAPLTSNMVFLFSEIRAGRIKI